MNNNELNEIITSAVNEALAKCVIRLNEVQALIDSKFNPIQKKLVSVEKSFCERNPLQRNIFYN